MKIKLKLIEGAAMLFLLSSLNLQLSTAFAQGTAFTYQGRLQNNGSPASGTYNLTFSLFNVSSGGTAVAGPVTNSAVTVTNGLFTVAIDFGAGVLERRDQLAGDRRGNQRRRQFHHAGAAPAIDARAVCHLCRRRGRRRHQRDPPDRKLGRHLR